MSVTTLDGGLSPGSLEPPGLQPAGWLVAISRTRRRRRAGRRADGAGDPRTQRPRVGAGHLAGLCRCRAARHAGYVVLRLPYAVKEIFDDWPDPSLPGAAATRCSAGCAEMRGGKLNDPALRRTDDAAHGRWPARSKRCSRWLVDAPASAGAHSGCPPRRFGRRAGSKDFCSSKESRENNSVNVEPIWVARPEYSKGVVWL